MWNIKRGGKKQNKTKAKKPNRNREQTGDPEGWGGTNG